MAKQPPSLLFIEETQKKFLSAEQERTVFAENCGVCPGKLFCRVAATSGTKSNAISFQHSQAFKRNKDFSYQYIIGQMMRKKVLFQ